MVIERIAVPMDVGVVEPNRTRTNRWSDYWMLTKPEVNFLIAIATGVAFCIGSPAPFSHFAWVLLLYTLFGTVLVASGAAALNQLIELRFDAQMRRTARRPLVSGRIDSSFALWLGISMALFGIVWLALSVNFLASLLATLTLFGYLFLYTPLKRRTALCTLVGAFPGAVPPLIGWVAGAGVWIGRRWSSMQSYFCGSFRTSWQSPGCTEMTIRAPDT
jgi:heme o synthase